MTSTPVIDYNHRFAICQNIGMDLISIGAEFHRLSISSIRYAGYVKIIR